MKYKNNLTNGSIEDPKTKEKILPYALLQTGEEETLIKTRGGHITTIPTTNIPEEILKDITTTPKKTTTKKQHDKKQETKKE